MTISPTSDPEKKTRWSAKKICAWSACALWAASIILSFAIPPGSPYIWVPDTVLLLGFFPLLWICPFSLIWIAFGVLTGFIGLFLLILTNIPNTTLPQESLSVKKHLEDYHPCWSWMILGAFVTIYGSIRLIINTVKLVLSKKSSHQMHVR